MKTRPYECLGRYRIEAEIGRGAMGLVYRARDPKIDRLVAIKTISLSRLLTAQQQQYRKRFVEEARAAGRLSHPGIVTLFDVGEHPASSEPYLVMEYVTGPPLSALMSGSQRLSLALALQFTLEVAEALGYAHSQGVIHRDIKPENILITEDGHAKVTDFGVARLKHAVAENEGLLFGTPAYMSPEQLAGGLGDGRSDLFSLGVILYGMITGFRPFQGNTTETVCFKVMNAEPVPVTSFEAELPAELDEIVARAMAKDPHLRFQTGAEMADAIRGFLADETERHARGLFSELPAQESAAYGEDRPARGARKPARRLLWQAAICALAVASVMTVWQLRKPYRHAAAIPPPVIPVSSAPAAEKPTPSAVHSYRRREVTSAKTEVASAKMRVEILHHFSTGSASIWLDHKLLFQQALHGDSRRHSIFRAVEIDQVANLQFAAGKHQVEIRVVAPENTYDQSHSMDADFRTGPEHLLLVNCDKRKMQVNLR